MRVIALLVLCAAIACATAAPQFTSTRGWQLRGRAHPASNVRATFAIRQRNLKALEERFWAVSDPDSPVYGKHMSLQEVGQLTSDPEAAAAVEAWLRSNGVASLTVTKNADFIIADLPIKAAEAMFSTTFYALEHPSSTVNMTLVRTPAYSLPDKVRGLVDFVAGLTSFPPTAERRMPPVVSYQASQTSGNAVPSLLVSYYGLGNSSVASPIATQAVFETLGQTYSPADLSSFQKQYSLPVDPITKVVGTNNPQCSSNPNSCGEANLDVQYIMAVARGSPTTFWSISSSSSTPYLDFVTALASDSNPPLVHSISYGDIEKSGDPSEMNRFNTEVQKLGVRGLTVFVSSGDDGVANFQARSDPSKCGFSPSFPATSPYVTSVGATQGPEAGTAEVACTSDTGGLITTGGGFSTVFSQPSYQSSAVSAYMSNPSANLPPSSMYDGTGRGYPDVSALGHNYVIYDGGKQLVVSGTSASSPVFAAMITLVNAKRLNAGKSSLGFLNPSLYKIASSTPSAFHDITSGENNCCAGQPGSQTCCQYGFTATSGWDPLTGLGSPDFPTLSAALESQ